MLDAFILILNFKWNENRKNWKNRTLCGTIIINSKEKKMSDTFESLELAPWIVRQTAKLGKELTSVLTAQINVLAFMFPIFCPLRLETSNTHPSELHSENSIWF